MRVTLALRRALGVGLTGVVALVAAPGVAACGSSMPGPESAGARDVALPGVDTSDFTARERHEFSEYVKQLPAPCSEVAVPIAQCVIEKRACATCLPAAQAIAKAVREGMVREQVEALYRHRFDASTARTIPFDGSPSKGPENAPVVLVEFADFECPFCQKIAPEIDSLWDQRKASVRFVYKFMPLQMHPHAEPAARAAIAAMDQGKFWEMHDKLFANGQHLEPADLDAYAKAVGLDLEQFHADMQSPATSARLAADKKLGDDLGVKGTPTIFIDGHEYDSKVDLPDWLDQEIAARKK